MDLPDKKQVDLREDGSLLWGSNRKRPLQKGRSIQAEMLTRGSSMTPRVEGTILRIAQA